MTQNVKRCLALIAVGLMAVLAHAQEHGRSVPAQQGGAPGRGRGGPG